MCEVHNTNLQMMMVAPMMVTSSTTTTPIMVPATIGPTFLTLAGVMGAGDMGTGDMGTGDMGTGDLGVSGVSTPVSIEWCVCVCMHISFHGND